MYGSACSSRARRALIVAGGFVAVATGFFAFTAPADAIEVCGAETFLTVEFTNNSASPLTLKEVPDLEGEFCARPPHTIGINQKVVISSYNTIPFTGTEFTLVYELPDHTRLEVNYEVPEFGSNSSRASVPPEYVIHTAEPENFLFTTTFEGCRETVGDGICDEWKRNGVTIDPTTGKSVAPGTPGGQFIDLPHMGVSLDRPTVMVQMDWMENEAHNQKLRQSAIDKVIEAYNNEPVTYPGATRSGVTLVVDAGPDSTITPGGEKWGSLSRAKAIPWKENFTTGKRSGINFTPYEELFKNNFVPTGRKPIFHYDTVVAALSSESEGTSGWTPSGDGSIISLGDWTGGVGSEKEQAGTFMHEQGHVQGLAHGGEDTINFKPNYPSVMNYFYQTIGVPRNNEYVFDYSREPEEPNVEEAALTEAAGISLGTNLQKYGVTWWCPKRAGTKSTFTFGPMDLNCDGTTPDGGTGFDVGGEEGEGQTVLAGAVHSDWERLHFKTGGVGTGLAAGGEAVLPSEIEAVDEITPAIAAQVRRVPQITYTGKTSGDYHDAVTASASLVDPTFSPAAGISGAGITFKLGPSSSDTCTATTGASGIASCTITPTQAAAGYNIVATFDGDGTYQPATAMHGFTVGTEETATTYAGPTVILAGASAATLSATMAEDGSADNDKDGGSPAPVPSEPVTLSLGAQSCMANTDSAGKVSCTIPHVTVPLGPETAAAAFTGDSFYSASSDSKSVIVFAFPSRGAFLLGDRTVAAASATTKVTWWADTWSGLNALTGGGASPALKGFTANITLPTTTPVTQCASKWNTTGGNSAGPPATVPAYMGTVVTSEVTKSGSPVSGNAVKIVVVKTNPGYSPDPGHPGTGTIVGTFC